MERNTIEQTALTTTTVDENTATVKLAESAFEKIYVIYIICTIIITILLLLCHKLWCM